MEILQWRILTY